MTVENYLTASGGQRAELVAIALLGAVADCQRALYDYATDVWSSHSFGDGSSLGPHFTVEPIGDAMRVDIGWTIATWVDDDSDNGHEFQFKLVLDVRDSGVVVQVSVEAFLEPGIGDYEAGLHVVHRTVSGELDLAAALAAARIYVAALQDLDDRLPAMGFPSTS